MGISRIARIIKTEIEEYIIHTVESHYMQNQLCEQLAPSGDDSPALPEDRCLMIPIEGTGNFVVAAVMGKSQGAEPGDKLIYSRDSDGNIKGKVWIHNDGSIEVEGTDITVKGNVKITGGTCEIAGTPTPSGSGSLCAMPYCAFTGAPQAGEISSGN
ncbi:MAG: hypothetical protein MJZ37_07565 [Bacilli bacterium]|nr:hypothetical protein [Bacilli bacterium]